MQARRHLTSRTVHVLFATTELAPVAQVGGLAVAASGLVRALREMGVEVTVVLPDYGGAALEETDLVPLAVPAWAGPAVARHGVIEGVGQITLVKARGSERSHPYQQADGSGWPDNDRRFLAFSAAVAALCEIETPDVLHLNDWHTSATLAFLFPRPPAVLTIHNLSYQGQTNWGWLNGFPHFREAYYRDGDCNLLVGGLRLADAIIAVSPTYAREILTEEWGMGVEDVLQSREDRLVGILNGIDTAAWDPAADPHLPRNYDGTDLGGKDDARRSLMAELGLTDQGGPLVVVVSRLVEQKGVDLLLPLLDLLDRMPAQVAMLGDGDQVLAQALQRAAAPVAGPGGLPARLRRSAVPPALRRRRPAGHAQPLRAVRPGADAGHALRHAARRHRRGGPARHGGRHRRPSR